MSSMCAEEPGPLRYLDNGLLDVTPTEEYVAMYSSIYTQHVRSSRRCLGIRLDGYDVTAGI
ncbi:hypothetical protein SNOG_04652 [Parastagonospora nodorum SN15]|uniref:Uncharacterized protein n=1 Tax=Phaeosphaeria nodorum (strain SN15 / ATCC MYA-4574 / FGSC 10173) TaxID=321614 RepID=Q0UUB2_PHANO|nr:hypothetical protein SNOG_04652 [Parastagonospora nodorum SN15]EAT88412.1 hypothetical protein SNOG_04652 [Parastagonospora nodorum SN15]